MPEFVQKRKRPYALIEAVIEQDQVVRIRCETREDFEDFARRVNHPAPQRLHFADRQAFSAMIGQLITDRTKSIWHPFRPHISGEHSGKVYVTATPVRPQFPVYIVSKGRWESRLTSRALETMGVPYRIVIEGQEYEQYAAVINPDKILVLPPDYLDKYDTCDDLGVTKSKGPGAARNFCWDHAVSIGAAWHWVMDDNLDAFHWMNRNSKHEVMTGATLKAAEDFVLRYENIAIAGLNYYSFCKTTDAVPPYVLNTRIYSCLLIRNDIPFRWRGRYNEDTDICLRALKSGWCTLQFNAFLCGKVTTQRMTGGNTKEFYEREGTLAKSRMLADMHPDVAKVVFRFHRWHHHVDYRPFKNNRLIRKPISIPDGVNNYGMVLKCR